jgi:hypothetical protein
MPNFAIVENKKVVNTVVADHAYAAEQGWVELSGEASIGWDYVNGKFIDNRPTPVDTEPATPTKEELLAQLNAIAAQIQALGA